LWSRQTFGFITIYNVNYSWSLKIREGRESRVFENTVLRRIFGPKARGSRRRLEKIANCRTS
jgi:hypothetical protein